MWVVTFVAVVILDVGYGLVVGVAYGLLTVVGRTQMSVHSNFYTLHIYNEPLMAK